MEDTEHWVLKCTICGRFHAGNPVDRTSVTLAIPLDGPYECPIRPPTLTFQCETGVLLIAFETNISSSHRDLLIHAARQESSVDL